MLPTVPESVSVRHNPTDTCFFTERTFVRTKPLFPRARKDRTLLELSLNPNDADDPIDHRPFNAETARLLVDAGVDVNRQEGSWYLPLNGAVGHGDLPLVQAMLEHGANPNFTSRGQDRRTALCIAAGSGNLAMVNALLDAGADPKGRPTSPPALPAGFPVPLKEAVQRKHLAVVKRLVEAGADVNLRDEHGSTPLSACLWPQNLDALRYLLEHGGDPNLPLPEDRNLMRNAEYGRTSPAGAEMYRLLLKHGGKPAPPLPIRPAPSKRSPSSNTAPYAAR
jgi:ankyrin repeat protein